MTSTNTTEPSERMKFAREIARRAGAATLTHFQQEDLPTEMKRDGTPVTLADREAEQLLRGWVRERFPGDGLIGEEFGTEEGRSDHRWIFDPIDGTKSFMCGVPLYGNLIGVERREASGAWTPVIGVVNMPALEEMVWAEVGGGAWHESRGKPLRRARVSGVATLADAVMVTTGREYFERGGSLAVYERMAAACRMSRGWSDCYGLVLVATGRADVWCEPVMHVWDTAPAVPIMQEAGGRCTDWNGNMDIRASTCLATNGLVHGEAMRVVAGG